MPFASIPPDNNPLSLVYSGYYAWYSGVIYNQGVHGDLWSGSTYDSATAYYLGMYGTRLMPQYHDTKAFGLSLRRLLSGEKIHLFYNCYFAEIVSYRSHTSSKRTRYCGQYRTTKIQLYFGYLVRQSTSCSIPNTLMTVVAGGRQWSFSKKRGRTHSIH